MSTVSEINTLLANLESTVEGVLSYFEGPGATTAARIGDWGAWETLAHFLYWHEATAKGMEFVARGYGPYIVTGETDAMNDQTIKDHAGQSIQELVAQARQVQKRLDAATRQLNDLDAVVIERPEGGAATARFRLERVTRHWQSHTDALKAQG